MANVPYPISGETIPEIRYQIFQLIRDLYEEKIGGANLGDVFSIVADVFTLVIASGGGLIKTNNELAIDVYSTGGMQVSSNGLSIKILSTGGLETDATGLGIKLADDSLLLSSSGIRVNPDLLENSSARAFFFSLLW